MNDDASRQTEALSEATVCGLSQIHDLCEVLKSQMALIDKTAENAVLTLHHHLVESSELAVLCAQDMATSSAASSMLVRLHNELDTMGAELQFQDAVRQQIVTVVGALDMLSHYVADGLQRANEAKAFNPSLAMSEQMEKLYQAYVMDSQRAAHDAALKRDSSIADSAGIQRTELF